jgi:hypothetical protein
MMKIKPVRTLHGGRKLPKNAKPMILERKFLNVAAFAAVFSYSYGQPIYGQPIITTQPSDLSVSLGANAQFSVSATTTTPPILFQWQFAGTNLPWQTNSSLALTNIQMSNAGGYEVMLTDSVGSVTSRLASLQVDPTFTKITTGAIVTDVGIFDGAAWGDYNNDGFLDLFVANSQLGGDNLLYRNNGDGTFTKITTGSVVTDGGNSIGGSWGDFDNDGFLDLFVANGGTSSPQTNSLYHNAGNGTFAKVTSGDVVADRKLSFSGVWGDYDNDGYIDLFVPDFGGGRNGLYHNGGGSAFMKISAGPIVSEGGASVKGIWGDYDGDGLLDLFVANFGAANNYLYRN